MRIDYQEYQNIIDELISAKILEKFHPAADTKVASSYYRLTDSDSLYFYAHESHFWHGSEHSVFYVTLCWAKSYTGTTTVDKNFEYVFEHSSSEMKDKLVFYLNFFKKYSGYM